ncbi:proliferation marker protein Ki-67 [Athene noctua]|uniref:proliferation marker protein Ki-67 n=1 Tax=Athene noctua TaxID=126797 RepID=UPI003EB88FEB
MPLFGNIIVIKRNGTDGIRFPLTASSCLFGRRTECDIRIQLPQVSKEHCKIEVNENKEAILTNLSTINPTQLNGDCFQHPVPLKHGDVLTIIDRSFRFEYPLQSTPRKKRSRSPRDETLQVLHVQQVAEVELLHKPTWGSKSLHASENAEWEEKNANDKKQSTEEKTCKALPVKPQTPKSAHRAHLSSRRQSEMSPFSKLYEKLKCEMKVPKTLQEGNVCHQAARGDGKSVLLEPSARTSLSCFYDLGSLPREKARSRSENIGECKIKGEATCSELNQISAVGSATRKTFTRSPRASVSKEIAGDPGERNHLQDLKEVSTEGSSKCTEITSKSSKEKDANAAVSLKPCIVECLDCADKITIHSCPAAVAKLAQRTNTANVSEVDEYVLSPPMSRRRSPGSHFIAPPRETSGMNPVYSDTPTTRGRESLKCQSFPEMLAGTPREDSACGNDSPKQLPLAGKECLKPRRNSKQCTPGRAVKEEVLTEICDQANFVKSEEERSETPVSLSNSRSPRRSNRPSKELSRTSVHLVTPTSGELTSELSPPGSPYCESVRQRDRPRASGLLTEKVLETSAVQENPSKTPNRNDKGGKEELATKGHHQQQDLEDACDTRPRRLSSRRSSGNAALPKGNEAVSEVDVSDVLTGVDSGKTKMLSQKRKSGGVSLQPLEKRKRVSFGGHLSPELFDKSLPPNSPIKRGAIPARLNLPFGDSPRAVLKKAQGLKRFAVQELAEHLQKETMSPKHLPAGKSPAASSPASGKARPTPPLGSPAPFTKNRFSVSRITTPSPIAEEKDAIAENVNMKEKRDPRVKTPKSSQVHPDDKTSSTNTPDKLTKTAQLASKVTPVRRSGAVAVISAKRRSGASSANLLVAKSWAEVVKLGVARPQSKTVKRSVRKGRSLKKKTTSPKTPERKIKGHFSTGHAESPATIVVGRAYSTTVTTVGQVPKVVKNPIVMLNMNMDESFTGIAEMFQTPENKSGKTLPLASVQKTEFTPTGTAVETSELQTPEESGEMMVSPLNSSDASEQRQDSPDLFHFQTEESVKFVFDTLPMKTPEEIKAMVGENVGVESLSLIPEKERSRLKAGRKRRTPKQKGEPLNALSGIKQLMKTPKQKPEPIEDLSGIKQLMKTPKQKPEPIEDLSGIKQLMKTPKQKPEPIEDLSGIKQLMKTPKQKPEPIEDLSGIKQLMKTPKQKPEPIEDLSGIKQLMKTPKQKPEPIEDLSEPIEDLSGIKQLMKTPKQKPEPIEDLSGIKQLMKTPKQKPEPIEDLSGIKQLMKTPKQKPEPIEDLSGIKQLMKTPKQKPEPIEDLSGIKQLMKTPKQKPEPIEDLSGIKQLMKTPHQEMEPVTPGNRSQRLRDTPAQEGEAVKDVAGVTSARKIPKLKHQPAEAMVGVGRIFKTPKEKFEPIEDLFGISTLVKTRREKYPPVEDFVGLQRLMAEPKQKWSDFEEDCVGLAELFETPEEEKVTSGSVGDSEQEDPAPPCTNSSHKYEDKGNVSEGEDSQQKEAPSEDGSAQRPTKGRSRKTEVPPASAKQRENHLNAKELQSLGEKSTQEEMEEIGTSVAKSRGRGRRANRCIQEEMVSQHPHQEEVETDSFVGGHGAPQRGRRGKGKNPTELKHPSENLESCGKDSSVVRKQRTNRKQTLQECGINGILETEDDPTRSSSIQNENCHLQTGLKRSENNPEQGGVDDSEEMLLWPRRCGVKAAESREPPIPPQRAGRARNNPVKQGASEDLPRTRRQLRKGPSAKREGDNQNCKEDTKTATAEKSESGTKLERKTTENKVKFLRSARKASTEIKADICELALENVQNIPKPQETSTATGTETQSDVKNEIKGPQGDTVDSMSGIKVLKRTRKRKAEPLEAVSGIRQLMKNRQQELEPVTAGIGSQRLLETPAQEGEAVKDVAGVTSARKTPKLKHQPAEAMAGVRRIFKTPEGKVERRADGFGVGLKKPENNPEQGGVDDSEEMLHFLNKIPAAGSDSPALNHRQWAGNAQAVLKPKQTEIPQENLAQKNGTRCRRLRGRNVNFKLEEGSFKICGGNMVFPECEKGKTCKDGQRETPENPSLQVRRSRRRQVESIPQVPCVPSMENQTRIAGDSKDEASLKEQDSGLAATPSSTQENPLRRGKRREVAAASPTPRSPPVKRRGLPKGDDKKMSVREEENPSLGNKSLPAKTNASARGARKKIDLGGEVETGNIEERTNEEQNMSLETVSRAKEKPLGRGRRTGTALASHTTNPISLRGKRRLPADSGREEAPKEYRNVPLQTFDSPVKEDQLRRGRRIGIALVVEGTSSVLGNQGLSKESTRKKLILANHGTPEEQQNRLMAVAPLAKGNPSGVVRKKRIASRCEETTSPFLGKDPVLPRDKCQKRIKTQEVAPEQQATASSLRRKCQLPADDLASKKLRSECDENKSLQKGRRKKNQEQLVEEDVRAPQTTGGMDRKTRSSTRTSARTRK